MRPAVRPLCLVLLAWATLACGGPEEEPCSAADAAAGRCEAPDVPAWWLARKDWAYRLCEDWRRPDGSCELPTLKADYEECYRTLGLPDEQRLRNRGAGKRVSIRAGLRKTYYCLAQRQWVMTPEARARWRSRPKPAEPPS